MRADYIFVKEKTAQFNSMIFGGELPEIRIVISSSGSTLGTFSHPRIKGCPKDRDIERCVLRISNRYDLSEAEIEDTVIHELIHYYIWLRGYHDEPPHGKMFKRIMTDINQNFGRNITVRSIKTEAMLDGDKKLKHHYICVSQWRDGIIRVTDAICSSIFEIDRIFASSPMVASHQWYYTTDPWFNRIRKSRTARAYTSSPAELLTHLKNATPCRCEEGRFYQENCVER